MRDSHVPFLVAGGVSIDTVEDIMTRIPFATGIDVASGIRTDGEIDDVESKLAWILQRADQIIRNSSGKSLTLIKEE